jgi:hypothetical protein
MLAPDKIKQFLGRKVAAPFSQTIPLRFMFCCFHINKCFRVTFRFVAIVFPGFTNNKEDCGTGVGRGEVEVEVEVEERIGDGGTRGWGDKGRVEVEAVLRLRSATEVEVEERIGDGETRGK